jgi:acyl-CoA reductase-like NAD-dependent aldehyde dehydrogenase
MENERSIISTKSFINNEWIGHSTTELLKVRHKFTQQIIAEVVEADQSEIQFSIANSQQGFQTISEMSGEERRILILKMRDGLIEERERFLNLIVAEAGKPIDYAQLEIDRSLKMFEIAAEEALRISGEVIPFDFGIGVEKTAITKRFPIGPILAISPFNFPLNLALHKVLPAIAAGNSVILKPSPQTPLTALALGALAKKSGMPAGVLNIIICKNEDAQILVTDERIKMLSFTGSADVGWKLKALTKKKKVTLELGGNAAVIVDRSSNIDEAVRAISKGAYLYSGQVCISVQRIFVDHTVFDEFVEKMKVATAELKIGNPEEAGVIIGPLIDKAALDRIANWIEEAKSQGAEVLFGGEVIDLEKNIYAPTLLTKTNSQMKVNCEEAFGPIAIIEKVQYFDEVIREVNRSRYGLQAGLYTNQISQMKYAFKHLSVGGLIINSVPGFRIDSMPYGGVKDSGLGREGVKYAMEEMSEMKLLVF